ncbi:MAG: S-methyl-5'-thioadenosine phosphorylase [Chloroflexi bacterium]|nr:S-methyl-5'-thioadenosine phosphorylase [Chloroflexota bacterium]MCY3939040.1 S-methyl-5'-thioadenosine phosphorylase [Chloroflexota bacterium]
MSSDAGAAARLGVIGGSGFYEMEGLTNVRTVTVDTPFGSPSSDYVTGELDGLPVAFLPRHGEGHAIPPTALNVKANIWGFKSLGVEWLVSISAVGSMKEEIEPLHVVVPDQLFDRTRERDTTFFNEAGLVIHIGFADPFCPTLSGLVAGSAEAAGATVHRGGTYICIEGPQFSTQAESEIFRGWGVDVIGMTAIPEAKMAREAELHYATLAMSTDYDVWKGEPVSVEMVVQNLGKNVDMAKSAVRGLAQKLARFDDSCGCQAALQMAIMTRPDKIPAELRQKHDLLIGKYLS